MRCNPWLDRVLPPDADESAIRAYFTSVYPVTPAEQRQYARVVVLSLARCPSDVRAALEAEHG